MADTWYIDYSAGHLSGPTVLNAAVGPNGEHATGALRYIDDITNPSLVRTKHVTRAEYQSLQAAGVAMPAMFMEVSTLDPLGGYAQGQAYARRALAGADYLGFTGTILMCADRWLYNPPNVTIPVASWQAYLDGAVSVLGDRAGGYGFSDAADAARGHVNHFVQCGSRSAVRSWVNGWQDNNIQPLVGGIQTDRILIINPFPGGGGSTPVTPTQKGVPDMDSAELYPTPAGSVILDVDPAADELIIQVPWTSVTITKVAFFGRSPATGVSWRWTTSGAQRVDADRPWSVGDDGKGNNGLTLARAQGEVIGAEVNWSLANPVDEKGAVTHEVRGKAALHRKNA